MSFLFSLFGWTFIPDFLTTRLLAQLHRFLLLPPSQKGTPLYRSQYGLTFALVVLTYLLYTLVQSSLSLEPNFYQVLGVSPNVDDTGLKVAFRHFAKRYHPDRPGVGRGGEEMFMRVRDSFEALKDPVKRFAYDRFGPDIVHWKHCSTAREYLNHGLLHSSGYHIVTAVALLFWSAIGKPSPVSFWRYILFTSTLLIEFSLLLSPHPITFPLFPKRVTYQNILFLHQLFMFLSVALSRVAPQLVPLDEESMEGIVLERIRALVAVTDRESSIMLHTELRSILAPIKKEEPTHPSLARPKQLTSKEAEEALALLKGEIENLIIETNLKKDVGPLRSAWEGAVRRRGRAVEPARVGNFWEQQPVDDDDEEEEGGKEEKERKTIPPLVELPSPRPSPPPVSGGSPKKGHLIVSQ